MKKRNILLKTPPEWEWVREGDDWVSCLKKYPHWSEIIKIQILI